MRNLEYHTSGFGDLFHLNYQCNSRAFLLVPPFSAEILFWWLKSPMFLTRCLYFSGGYKQINYLFFSLPIFLGCFLYFHMIKWINWTIFLPVFYFGYAWGFWFFFHYLIYFFYILLVVRNLFFLSTLKMSLFWLQNICNDTSYFIEVSWYKASHCGINSALNSGSWIFFIVVAVIF